MATYKLTWNSLLFMPELDIKPGPPARLDMEDRIILALSLLTAYTGHDRRMLRCDDNGALLTNGGWSQLSVVGNDELYVDGGTADSYTAIPENRGLLIATSTGLCKTIFTRISGGATEIIYIPPDTLYWYPHPCYSVSVDDVPGAGTGSWYVGVTAFN